MIDTHCHLNWEPLLKEYQLHHRQAKEAGITHVIIPAVNPETSRIGVDMAEKLENTFAAVGIHPEDAQQVLTDGTDLDSLFAQFETWISQKKAIAIGECGLDYYRLPENKLDQKHYKAAQKKVFRLQLELAQKTKVPVIIHVRDAHNDAIQELSQANVSGVLHCFSGDQAYLEKALDLGFYISLAGNITFKNAKDLQALLAYIPEDKLLLETDAPYLNPNRGEFPNTPANIVKTYQFVAEKLGKTEADLTQLIFANAQKLFQF